MYLKLCGLRDHLQGMEKRTTEYRSLEKIKGYESNLHFTKRTYKSSNFVTILMKRTRLLNLKDMFRQLLCHRQFTDGMTLMNNI